MKKQEGDTNLSSNRTPKKDSENKNSEINPSDHVKTNNKLSDYKKDPLEHIFLDTDLSGHMPLEDDNQQMSIYINRLSRFKKYSLYLSLIVVILGIISCLGWFFNLPILRGEFMGYVGIKLQSALIYVIAGSCLYLLNRKLKPQHMVIPKIMAVIVSVWGAVTLLEYLTGMNTGIYQLFYGVLPGNLSVLTKSRFLSSLNFLLLGITLLMACYQYKIRWMQSIAFFCGFIGLLGFSSYLFGINTAYSVDLVVQMALLTSVMHMLYSVGLLCLYPDRYYMGRITAQNSGGFMARRLLPITFSSVYLLGLLIALGAFSGIYSNNFQQSLTIILTLAFVTTVIIWNANMLNKMDRKRQVAIQKRRRIRKFYESLVEGINEGIWVTDNKDRLYFMNRGMEEITGVKTQQMRGLYINDLPDETLGQLKESYKKAKETLKPVYYDSISITSPTGRTSYQSGWITPQVKYGKFNGAICTVSDQTKRRKAEEALSLSESFYKTIFENTGTATIIINEDNMATMANKKCEGLLGIKVDEIQEKKKWTDFVHPDDLEMMLKYHQMRRVPDEKVPPEYEFRLIDANKKEKQVMLFASIIPGTTDSVVSLLDITERKKSEIRIKNSLNEKELLLREIHHRVKNNMQIISSLLNLQRSYIDDEDADNLLLESQGRVKSMALVHEKLYQTSDLAQINVAEYIRSLTMNMFHSYSVHRSIKLQIDVGDVFFDIDTAVPLGLIINELVSNSLKYAFTQDNEGNINISLHEEPNNKDSMKYRLVVSDDGVGFPDDLDFRNTPSLGLQLVITLVNQLDGTIELIKNNGTCFKVIFQQQKYKDRV